MGFSLWHWWIINSHYDYYFHPLYTRAEICGLRTRVTSRKVSFFTVLILSKHQWNFSFQGEKNWWWGWKKWRQQRFSGKQEPLSHFCSKYDRLLFFNTHQNHVRPRILIGLLSATIPDLECFRINHWLVGIYGVPNMCGLYILCRRGYAAGWRHYASRRTLWRPKIARSRTARRKLKSHREY